MSKAFQYIHTEQIDAISAGDNDFKKELIDIFLDQIPEFIDKISGYLEDKNWEMLAREAHTAKSSALTFGMNDAGKLLKDIQIQLENKELDNIPEMVTQVLSHLGAAVPELNALKASI